MECLTCKYQNFILESDYSWDTIFEGEYSYAYGSTSYNPVRIGLKNGAVLTVEAKIDTDQEWGPKSYDDAYEQGFEGVAWMVLKVVGPDKTLFFRKWGTSNSYGHVSWEGRFEQVTGTEKQVTVYEWEGM
jgi:hypothetical protein